MFGLGIVIFSLQNHGNGSGIGYTRVALSCNDEENVGLVEKEPQEEKNAAELWKKEQNDMTDKTHFVMVFVLHFYLF